MAGIGLPNFWATTPTRANRFDSNITAGQIASGCDGNDTQWTAGAAGDFQWRCDDNGSSRWELIEVAQTGQAKLAAAVHKVMVRKGWIKGGGLTGVGPDCLHTQA